MKLFRNREYRREFILSAALIILGAAVGLFFSPWCSLIILLTGALVLAVHLWYLSRRYRRLSELSDEIDRLLHSEEQAVIDVQAEGELSILQSEIVKMTQRLREQTEALQSDKKRLSEAIEDIFHQLRTPLTSMNLSVEMLRDPELTPERRLRIAREIKKSLERIRWQVETLLKISKIDAGTALFRKDTVTVSSLIEKASEQLLIPMELREQKSRTEVGTEAFTGDLMWTAEAFGNLLKNAVEHTPEGGEICVSARETPIFTEIVICDNGPGFEPEDIPYLFDRFFRGQNASSDSIGIGLALSRMIITEENGTITAANRPEGGACFTVRFYKTVV
ncbi:MAG: HAMP domain-containing histidine kinase [Lachnospiraceae bacterium]|nr:HAMP domain-containing histidine kinase [Lachnospiraceae bacterium]